MTRRLARWLEPSALLELFVIFNLAFLAVDIYVAHYGFHRPAEWVPLIFSIVSPLVLVASAALRGGPTPLTSRSRGPRRTARLLGLAVGWASIAVGVAGLGFHLESQFFEQRTLESLVYTAPFSAPLAYCGLGLLLILDRMVSDDDPTWARWVLLMAAGGFLGNFALTLADHAQNGFFHPTEWLSVAASAFAFSFTLMAAGRTVTRRLLHVTGFVIFVQAFIGLAGFALHIRGNLQRPGDWVSSFVYGAPVFAPLLFIDLALLAAIGLYRRLQSAPR